MIVWLSFIRNGLTIKRTMIRTMIRKDIFNTSVVDIFAVADKPSSIPRGSLDVFLHLKKP